MRLSVNRWIPLAALLALPACALVGGKSADPLPVAPTNGPAADYPVVVGEPFTIGGLTYTPEDTLNYDAVGFASVSDIPANRISAAHKTLPLPSYAEVTNLDGGRTILVRVDERGPMVNERVIELSQGAALQLGIVPGATAPVRVRRVNPPEAERALLRAGDQAPARMDTPEPLLKVLQRKLLERDTPLHGTMAHVPPPPVRPAPVSSPAPQPDSATSMTPGETEKPVPRQLSSRGDFVVQVAAFSTRERAGKAADAIGGFVTRPGQYWHVRIGPFASLDAAQPALEKARRAGYDDARIQRAD